MLKNKKSFSLLALSLITFATSCQVSISPDQAGINELKSSASAISIPVVDQGSISGIITLGSGVVAEAGSASSELLIRVFRDGKVIKTSKANDKGQFVVSGIPIGEVTVVINNQQSTIEKKVTVVKGKVISLGNISFATSEGTGSTVIRNVEGKVVKGDGTPVANAKVSDVTGGYVSNSVNTNNNGEFVLPVTAETKSRNLEVSSGNLTTSISIDASQLDKLTIPLIANSRTVKGKIVDSIIKSKPVADVLVKVAGTRISTSTDKEGNFILRGVPLSAVSLEIGNIKGYINRTFGVAQSANSTEQDLGSIDLQAIGNIFVNIRADNTRVGNNVCAGIGPFTDPPDDCADVPESNYVSINTQNGQALNYISNEFHFGTLNGSIQVEGTQITQNFSYPATPTIEPKPKSFVSADESTEVTVYQANDIVTVRINNIPSGEYTITVALDRHETQKGIKVVVPSNDTISTEIIQMNQVGVVKTVGDIVGKISIRDRDGNIKSTEGLSIRVAAVRGGQDLENLNTVQQLLLGGVTADSSGNYHLKNVPSGSRTIIAAVMSGDGLADNYIYTAYSLLNIVGGQVNKAPEMFISQR